MGRRLSTLHHPKQSLALLINEVQGAWKKVPQADNDHLILLYMSVLSKISCKFYCFISDIELSHCQKIKSNIVDEDVLNEEKMQKFHAFGRKQNILASLRKYALP